MAKKDSRGLSGKIEVSYEWDETSSGHVENTNSIELPTEGNKVILRERHSHQNYYKNNESRSSTKTYEIEVGMLLSLIKEHGKPSN
ncbi:MAG: hypothetical protein ABIG70_01760 [Pseudomonadota bacterium]